MPGTRGLRTLHTPTTKPSMGLMVALKRVGIGSRRRLSRLARRARGPTCTAWGWSRPCREVGDTVQVETRYFLTSLPAQGVRFAHAVRQHWGIENSLHWVLDVSFDEDACRIRKDKGAQTFAVLRHIALNLLRREPHHKRGIKARRKRAGWDRDYLFQVLTG